MNEEMFENIKYFGADLDGTVYLGDKLIDGVKEFFENLESMGKDYFFLTNNSSNNSAVCREKLMSMGWDVPESKILVSTDITVDYIKKNHPGSSVYLIGNDRLHSEFLAADIKMVETQPDLVVLGLDNTIDYEKIRKGSNFIIRGAKFIATHPDIKAPMGEDYMPDVGSLMQVFITCTGVEPVIIGKPSEITANFLTNYLNCQRQEICFIGDSIAADIALGVNNGMKTILVMTGVTTPDLAEKSDIKADLTVESIRDIAEFI